MPCLCTIDCDFALPLDRSSFKENVSFCKDIEGWAAQTDGLYIWDYTTDFSHYPMPFANVRTLQDNLRFFRAHGAKYIYEEGDHGGRHGDFAELKTWLLAKWLWNPDLPEEALLDDFFGGYYGAGAPFVRRYFDELHRRQAEWSSAAPDRPLKIFSDTGNPALSDKFLADAAKMWAQAAEAVRDELISLGIDPSRMLCLGLAADDPWHIDDTDASNALIESKAKQNRKVMIIDLNSEDARLLGAYIDE